MTNPEPTQSRPSTGSLVAWTLIAGVAILCLSGYLVFRTVARLPAAAIDQGEALLETAKDLASAFRQGTVETRFVSYATSLSGSTYLQIATLERVEVYTREDRASILWGALELPEVVVAATAPVEYTAYVDLDEPWHLQLEGHRLRVTAPPIRFNTPAIDASRIEFEVREGSLLRDEEAALVELKRGLTSATARRKQELVPLVRDTAAARIEEFVRGWILHSYPESEDVRIEITFRNEVDGKRPNFDRGPID